MKNAFHGVRHHNARLYKARLYKAWHPAVYAVWAAVVSAGYLLPAIPIWGTGRTFSFANALNPLSGIFFGPFGGALSSAVGGFIGSLIAPHTAWLGPFTFIMGMTTAFTTGCIAWGKWPQISIKIKGSFIYSALIVFFNFRFIADTFKRSHLVFAFSALIVYFIGTILWFTQEIGRKAILIPIVFYGLGFIVMNAGLIFSNRMLTGKSHISKFLAIWMCSFGGLVGGATIGNFFSLALYEQPVEAWTLLAFISPVERAIFAFAAMIIGVPLLIGLNKIGIFVGPQEESRK